MSSVPPVIVEKYIAESARLRIVNALGQNAPKQEESTVSRFVKQYLPPVGIQNSVAGYSLEYAIEHPRKLAKSDSRARPHRLPKGWRWLKIGEVTKFGYVACDRRIAPVKILVGGDIISETHHPVRREGGPRKRGKHV